MARNEDVASKGTSQRGERPPIDVASFLSRTGPLTVKPMQNIMFEMESTSSQGKKALPEMEHINHQEGKKPSVVDVNKQLVGKVSSMPELEPIHGKSKNGFSTPRTLGSSTISKLGLDKVEAPKFEQKYNPGVLQGNWISERMNPKYKPIHPPPINTSNLVYRSTYKEAFLNHKLKNFSSVMTKEKDKSLPPLEDDRTKPRKSSASGKQAMHSGHGEHTRVGYGGKDPYKGHDEDPFKRRDEYGTGYAYKLDAFQERPSLWDRYGGRDTYFRGKGQKKQNSHDETAGKGSLNSGDGPSGADSRVEIQGNPQRDLGSRTTLPRPHETSQEGSNHYASPKFSGTNQRATHHGVRPQQAVDTSQGNVNRSGKRQLTPWMLSRGRPTDQYSVHRPPRMNHQEPPPQQTPDTSHVGTIRRLESDLAEMKFSSEYKNSFKATESTAVTAASKRQQRKLATCAAARNVSTFAF